MSNLSTNIKYSVLIPVSKWKILYNVSTLLMKLKPSNTLSPDQVQSGLKLVVKDGLATEAMATLTGGTFLIAIALHLGASNVQIGILAALPTFSNIFQLVAIWLVQRFNNRRAVVVCCAFLSRFPLILIGMLPLLFSGGTSVKVMIFVLFFHYFFGSIAGASWNSWMKDLIPAKILGTYFSHRTRLIQIINVTVSLTVALSLDYVKSHYPAYEMTAYICMFLVGGALGMLGVYALSRTPEPQSRLNNENMFKLFRKPLKDKNFRKLLMFQAFWAFSLNLATPFFSVYMMKTVGLPLSYIIAYSILAQLSSIVFIKLWGRYSDRYSNKTIIRICAPIYIACILAWTFTASDAQAFNLILLALIHILSGISTAGINLAIGNISIKLAPKDEAIVYFATKSMITAFIPALAPVLGGLLADFFASHQLLWNISWKGPEGVSVINLLDLQNWNFFFIIGATLAMLSLRALKGIKEEGEVQKGIVVTKMATYFRIKLREKRREVYKIMSLSFRARA